MGPEIGPWGQLMGRVNGMVYAIKFFFFFFLGKKKENNNCSCNTVVLINNYKETSFDLQLVEMWNKKEKAKKEKEKWIVVTAKGINNT